MKPTRVHAGLLTLLLASTLTSLVYAADPVGRSPLAKDPKYTSLAPMDQLKKLAELTNAKTPPADLNLLRQDAARRYLHAESKGKPADEFKAYQQLTAAAKTEGGPLAGLSFEMRFDSPFVDNLYCSALLADPTWQAGDPKARLDLLTDWDHKGLILQNLTTDIAAWVVLEQFALKTTATPLKDRGLAKLKVLADLATGDWDKGNFVDSPASNWLWGAALAEHLAFLPDWPATKPADRLAYLRKLYADVKMDGWAGKNEEYCAARDLLRADPRFTAAADPAARKKVITTFAAEQKLRNFTAQALDRIADDKEDRSEKGPRLDTLAAALGPIADPAAALKKLGELRAANSVLWADYYALSLPLAFHYVLPGDPTKPSSPAAEIAKWKTLRDNDSKAPLKSMATDISGPLDLPALASAVVADPTYAKATWLNRRLILDKVQAGYAVFSSPLDRPRDVMTHFALVSETASTTPQTRGEAELRLLQKIRPADANEQLQDATLHNLIKMAIDDHFSEHPAPPKARFAQMTTWLSQKLLTIDSAVEPLSQAAVEMLEDDPAFMKADVPAKKARVQQMVTSKQLEFFTSIRVKEYFKLGQ